MLQRIVRILGEVVSPVAVVAAVGQELPSLPAETLVLRDEHPTRGPLEGIRVALTSLAEQASAVYVSGCDTPLMTPGFIRRVLEFLIASDAVIPFVDGRYQPLAAAYRVSILPVVERLLREDRLRAVDLVQELDGEEWSVLGIGIESFLAVDPFLESVKNVNTPEDYRDVLVRLGLPPAG
jgi:molybdopterin-guanine dinucleotide biosynthesis protein A